MRYVVSVDTTKASKKAIEEAEEYVKKVGGELELVHVAQQKPNGNDANGNPVIQSREEAETRGRDVLAKTTSWVDEVEVTTTLLWGKPGEEVAEYANEEDDVKAVFVGHRGLSSRHEKFVGSTAKNS